MKISDYILYAAKLPQGKTSAFFTVFTQSRIFSCESWPIDNISLHKCYSKSFTVNSYCPL